MAAVPKIGVAGWDYPDWSGIVYPARSGSRFDRLAYLARYVDAIEINSTFYRPVAPRVAASWARRIAHVPDLRFTAKCHRRWTHETPADWAQAVGPTLSGLEPLLEAGRLGALLLQFPQSFHWSASARERLERLRDLAAGWPLVLEVRHASWRPPEVESWLRAREIGWCAVDQPRVGSSTLGVVDRVTAATGYLRLHGRNAADWFREDAGRDARYDYLYRADELRSLCAPLAAMAAATAEMFVVQNNHFRGKALVNALQLKRMLLGTRPAAPDPLVAAYPELGPDVRTEQGGLF